MSIENFKSSFFKLSLENLLQIMLMICLLLNWYGSKESTNASVAATQAVTIQTVSQRVTKLEDSTTQLAVDLQQVKSDLRVLVAIAEEQRKKQK